MAAFDLLIVDNESLVVDSLAAALTGRISGLRVATASSGVQALDLLERDEVKLIMASVDMPAMSGKDFVTELIERNCAVPVVAMSERPVRDDDALVELGVISCQEKPVDVNTLAGLVNDVVCAGPPSQIRGISLSGFAQLLEQERKTCSLHLSTTESVGKLIFRGGKLVSAASGDLMGDEAARHILAWSNARIQVSLFPQPSRPNIGAPLSKLLLDGLRQWDEQQSGRTRIERGRQSSRPAPAETSGSSEWELQFEFPPPANPQTSKRVSTIPPPLCTLSAEEIEVMVGAAMKIRGSVGAALIELATGVPVHTSNRSLVNVAKASGRFAEMLRIQSLAIGDIGLTDDAVQDVLVMSARYFHILRRLAADPRHFLYLVVESSQCNLAMARHKLHCIERETAERVAKKLPQTALQNLAVSSDASDSDA